MVSIYMEDTMSLDTIFATAVEMIAKEQGKDIKSMAHEIIGLSSPDVSIREFRRITRPDRQGRYRTMTLREAYEFSHGLGKSIDDVIAYGLTKTDIQDTKSVKK